MVFLKKHKFFKGIDFTKPLIQTLDVKKLLAQYDIKPQPSPNPDPLPSAFTQQRPILEG